MPELPEVETTKRGIAPHVVKQKITAVHVVERRLRWPVAADLPEQLRTQTVLRLERRSKYLLFYCERGLLLIHLGMTGNLRVYRQLPARQAHDHIDFCFANGITLRYRDPRRFGCVLWLTGQAEAHPLLARLGPEPLSNKFDAIYLYQATRKRKIAIKLAIMDNRLVVGVGNIYANEALFRTGIRPTRQASRLTAQQADKLVAAIKATLSEAIAKGGSTLRDFVDSTGAQGYFQFSHAVYGRENLPCRLCAAPIKLIRQGGRASYYCPSCQK